MIEADQLNKFVVEKTGNIPAGTEHFRTPFKHRGTIPEQAERQKKVVQFKIGFKKRADFTTRRFIYYSIGTTNHEETI
jgi:hypothetical protein